MEKVKTKEELMGHVRQVVWQLNRDSRFYRTRNYRQHGNTSVYMHSIAVCIKAVDIALKFKLNLDWDSLIRGALLHDYFLYDYHDKTVPRYKHGITHAKRALKNAEEDFELNDIEREIIGKHMFPVNPKPPRYIETWIVTLADKIVAVQETFKTKAVKKRILEFGNI